MPVLILDAAIAFARLLAPRRVTETIQRMLTNIAIAQSTTRWLAMTASEQHGDCDYGSLRDGPAKSNGVIQ